MGLIIDNGNMYEKFKCLLNQEFFVDKSNIINDFNKLIGKDGRKNVCITKPRRFGKTSIAALLTTYYSKGFDSQEIFDKLKVSKGKSSDETEKKKEIEQYREFQGKYHTLYFVFHLIFFHAKNKTGEKFIIIIDEWDYIIFNNDFSPKEKVKYIRFLKSLIKDKCYSAFAYMTGISPIAKEFSQSTLNCFDEYSMLKDKKYYQYFGFTEQEVRDLCEKNKKINKSSKIKYEDLENWYNGYKAYNGEKIFNPWSIYHALVKDRIKNYWTKTGGFDELVNIINFNILGVKDNILELIKGKNIEIELKGFGTENNLNSSTNNKETNEKTNEKKLKAELYSKMVTFGFLTYYDGKISIPNKELEEKFINVLRKYKDLEYYYYYNMINNSGKMLEMTLEINPKEICKILENSHMENIKPGDKMDHGNLKHVVEFAYFNARINYIVDEVGKGKGISDFIFYPKDKRKAVIIIELKMNGSAKKALKQIHRKKYYHGLNNDGYEGNILLLGINLNTENKLYSCIIEERDNELKKISVDEYPKSENKRKIDQPNSKNKRKTDQESDVNFIYCATSKGTSVLWIFSGIFNPKDWDVKGYMNINSEQLSLGTYDNGTYGINARVVNPYARTQNLNIKKQLRYFYNFFSLYLLHIL
ncbi:hypothetical protein BCR32DRAFT_297222 [Anaeromyces robustus]|uniref:AAA-ATPase-like domain-containing protein n=1 Tax=Anaeromyces robustus TaxID=1754192 RepID=A0A1Y1WGG3_9FUNG|nr:hypothetical protein BCR32DRAFT_297222 [Anaeromyces robustus]|eukprot:ORX72562.1 hypothetical protein BCR32DRAFT_297222 [Anaeromyces robustus]